MGLFRHYWVLLKLLLTIPATALFLLVHVWPIGRVARAAAATVLSPSDLHAVRVQLLFDAGAAKAVLLVTTTLSVYKPQGLTPYGHRKRRDE